MIMFVSVNQSYRDGMTLEEVKDVARRAWALSLSKAKGCTVAVAVFQGFPVGAWQIKDAYPTEETYPVSGTERPRIGLVLGEAMPVLERFADVPDMRRGVVYTNR